MINSSDVFVIKGFTVLNPVIPQSKFPYHSDLTSGDLWHVFLFHFYKLIWSLKETFPEAVNNDKPKPITYIISETNSNFLISIFLEPDVFSNSEIC